MFSKIGCNVATITDMLGGHAGVTDITVLQYLGIVEQRTNELLQLQAFIQAKVSQNCTVALKCILSRFPLNAISAIGI